MAAAAVAEGAVATVVRGEGGVQAVPISDFAPLPVSTVAIYEYASVQSTVGCAATAEDAHPSSDSSCAVPYAARYFAADSLSVGVGFEL